MLYKLVWLKRLEFCQRISGFWLKSHYYHRKTIICGKSERTWNSQTFLKKWWYVEQTKKDMNPLHQRISRPAGYIYQSSSCLGISRMVVWGNIPVLQKTGATRGIRGLLWFTLQHGRPLLTLKCLKNNKRGYDVWCAKRCHKASQGVLRCLTNVKIF